MIVSSCMHYLCIFARLRPLLLRTVTFTCCFTPAGFCPHWQQIPNPRVLQTFTSLCCKFKGTKQARKENTTI